MASRIRSIAILSLSLAFSFGCFSKTAQGHPKPLQSGELLALVAGQSLSENVVFEIRSDGLAFVPDQTYTNQLKAAGANDAILAALKQAKIAPNAVELKKADEDRLQSLVNAAQFMQQKKYDQAAGELNSGLKALFLSNESGFVMGEILRFEERWPEAVDVYSQVLRQDPDFPEIHTKLSFALTVAGQPEEGLREAKAALARTPDNPEAHRYAGMALSDLRKFDAAREEFQRALELKPDYAQADFTLAVLADRQGNSDLAIAEYKKFIALSPDDWTGPYNLGAVYQNRGDNASAIREYREAKRIAPERLEPHVNLAAALKSAKQYPESAAEYEELAKLFPDSEFCHQCYGEALYSTWRFDEARKQFNIAIQMDPGDPDPHVGLGGILEQEKKYADALVEYRFAETLDSDSIDGHRGAGRVLLAQKDFKHAAEELKQAVDLKPSDAKTHEFYGRALEGVGDEDSALREFQESFSLDSSNTNAEIEMAGALEKKGQWPDAIARYRQAALAQASVDKRHLVINLETYVDASVAYKAAQARLDNYLASLKSSGKSAEAANIEKQIHALERDPALSDQLTAAMQQGEAAAQVHHFDESEAHYKTAVALAEKLQPQDARLSTSLDHLGNLYMGRQDFTDAQAAFERELKVLEQLYGNQSPGLSDAYTSLGTNSLLQHDFKSAQSFYERAVAINEKTYGETSTQVADSLRISARVYMMQNQYDKAEAVYLHAVQIDESIPGVNTGVELLPLSSLCGLYDMWGKPEKSAPCAAKLQGVMEKLYGADSPMLVPVLTKESQSLRKLGRDAEAELLEQRVKSIQAGSAVAKKN